MDLDTRHLRALVAVADHGSFTGAALELGLSQASVSRSVQRLEAGLGLALLTRTSRHVEVTPSGERVIVQARRILAGVADLEAVASRPAAELRVGYAWAALGAHTLAVQRVWEDVADGVEVPDLVFVQTNSPTAGLAEGRCAVSVVRRPVGDDRLEAVRVGAEQRYAVLATDEPLAARSSVTLADLAGRDVAADPLSGTTREDLWPPDAPAVRLRSVSGVDDYLTLIASGRAVGVSSEATAAQHPRPGIAYRPVVDAPAVDVWLAWWRDDPPPGLDRLVALTRTAYRPRPAGQ
jgi:DNA-binding transcriptional LysR family regulator